MNCPDCAKPVEYVIGGGWAHSDPEVTHPVSLAKSSASKTLVKTLPTYEEHEVDAGLDALSSRGHVRVVSQFLQKYYCVGEIPWQEVRKHDQGEACHCNLCPPCEVCTSRKPFVYKPIEENDEPSV